MKAKVNLGRGNDGVRLEFTDEVSGTQFLEAYFNLEDWAKVLFSSGGKCEFEFRTKYIGKHHEMKVIAIDFHNYIFDGENTEEAAKKAVEPYETDGWKGEWRDLLNYHRRAPGSDSYSVTFHRYV